MAKKTSHLNKIKIKPTGPLADMIGNKAMARPEVTKKVWAYINKHDLKGETGDGHTVKYRTKAGKSATSKGAQVIHAGEDDLFYEFAGNKEKISMMQIAGLVEKHSKSA
jgi:hypothetical protein|tara:strand:+ start:346 stop:672 length:327 start_codon:yes stop_codon:yes gene_type:complete